MDSQFAENSGAGIAAEAARVQRLVDTVKYKWGGKTPDGFDCSGFVAFVYKNLFPTYGPRFQTNVEGYLNSALFETVDSPKPGDIVIFKAAHGYPNHIGIVVDGERWVGSQTSTGVAYVAFNDKFWGKRKPTFRRFKSGSPQAVLSYLTRNLAHA